MPKLQLNHNRSTLSQTRRRAVRPLVEGLEARLLLYSDLGDQWTYDSRITYSFMPDGTSVGGVPSALFQTLNAKYPTATWEGQIEQAASLWENVTNANLALVSDGGEPVGTSGNQQDDPRFGDIRIGAVPLPSGVLAETFLPPPDNGGTDAGDILFNSTVNWQINSNYDLMTVAAHEIGHALGLGESSVSTAVMYGTYNGIKQSLASDDTAGIDSIYGTRQFDQFNTGGHHNSSPFTPANINGYISSTSQIAIPSLDITTPGQAEWFFVNVPASTTGKMTVTAQSSNLSSLAPLLQFYNSSLSMISQTSAPNTFGATISLSTTVASGQGYYVKVTDAGGPGSIGGYGLLVNFGSQPQSPIQPPNTVVGAQPDQGGGSVNNAVVAGGNTVIVNSPGAGSGPTLPTYLTVGTLSGWTELMVTSTWTPTAPGATGQTQPIVAAATGTDPNAGTAGPSVTQQNVSIGAATPSSDPSSTAQATPTVVAAGPAPAAVQAVDEALGQLVADDES
jgi:Matrixin